MLLEILFATVQRLFITAKILYFYRASENIESREKTSNLDESSLQSTLCKKAFANVAEYTGTSGEKSESEPEVFDLGLESKSESSFNEHDSANDSCVDPSSSCSTDATIEEDSNSVNESKTLKNSKTLYYKTNKNNNLER